MRTPDRAELDRFLAAHPQVRFFDAILADLNAVERGKRVDRGGIDKIFTSGLPLPGSMFALDVLGGTIEATGLGFDDGDADRPCLPIPGTLYPVPWLGDEVAQFQITMRDRDGSPFFGEPRNVLARVLERFAARGLTPVVAVELEFYFAALERGADGLPQPPLGPLTGRREFRTQINAMRDLDEFSALLVQIDTDCRAQGVPTTSALAEYGPGQYEVNLAHSADALRACDEAIRFKRVVKSVARRHGMEATFLAKPYRDMAGSGLHVHVSLLDAHGRNVFACDDPLAHAPLRHAIGGTLATLGDGMAICAPNANSYRRFRPEAYVPMEANWSINNRGSAVRVPMSDAANRRIEHRLAGADANPYLVMAWVLAGIEHGLERRIEPPTIVTGNAYRQEESSAAHAPATAPAPGDPGSTRLPRHWATAIDRFERSSFAREALGAEFAHLLATVKRGELEDFDSYLSPLECDWYFSAL